MNKKLVISDLTVGYGGPEILHGINLDIPEGKITTIIGPNGCGKSTLLRTIAKLNTPTSGSITLDGQDIKDIKTKPYATRLGFLPQQHIVPEGITVGELVGRGRYAHLGVLGRLSDEDHTIIRDSLSQVDLLDREGDLMSSLSGGQQQRAWLAMVLAQQTDVLLLDEPTTYLDMAHQIEMVDLLTELNVHHGRTIVMVLHELNIASRCAENAIAMKDGRVHYSGIADEVLTAPRVSEVFNFDVAVLHPQETGTPVVVGVAPDFTS